jgi:hypothetical protein
MEAHRRVGEEGTQVDAYGRFDEEERMELDSNGRLKRYGN